MSVIIRLQNLPWSANAHDIREFFKGLSIPEGGVHIVGGELGDAFIAFSSDEDARLAMQKSGTSLKGIQITLLLSSRTEMQKVIEAARQQAMGMQSFMTPVAPAPLPPPPPVQPITPAQLQQPHPGVQPQFQSSGTVQSQPQRVSSEDQPLQSNQNQNIYAGRIPQPNQPPQSFTHPYHSQQTPFVPNQMPYPGQKVPGFPPGVVPPPGAVPSHYMYGHSPSVGSLPSAPGLPHASPIENTAAPSVSTNFTTVDQTYNDSSAHSSTPKQPNQKEEENEKERKSSAPSSLSSSSREKRERDKGRDDRRRRSKSRSRSKDRDRRRRHRSRSRSRSRDKSGRRKRSRSRERERTRDRDRQRDRRDNRDNSRSHREKSERSSHEPSLEPKTKIIENATGIPGLGDIPDDIPKEGLSIFTQSSSTNPVRTKESPSNNSGWIKSSNTAEPKSLDSPLSTLETSQQKAFLLANPPNPNSFGNAPGPGAPLLADPPLMKNSPVHSRPYPSPPVDGVFKEPLIHKPKDEGPPQDWTHDDRKSRDGDSMYRNPSLNKSANMDHSRRVWDEEKWDRADPERDGQFPHRTFSHRDDFAYNRDNDIADLHSQGRGMHPERRESIYTTRSFAGGFQSDFNNDFDDKFGRGGYRGRGRRGGFARDNDRSSEPAHLEYEEPSFRDMHPQDIDRSRSGRGFFRGRGGRMPFNPDPTRERRSRTCSVEIRNVPSNASYTDIRELFEGIFVPNGSIKIIGGERGERIGVALVQFRTTWDAFEAYKRSGGFICNSRVQVKFIDDAIYEEARDMMHGNRERDHSEPMEVTSPCVYVSGLPVGCTDHDVAKLFEAFKFQDIVLELEKGSRQPSGGCFVKFISPEEAENALTEMKHPNIDGTPVKVNICSTEAMEEAAKERQKIKTRPPQSQMQTEKYRPSDIGTKEHIMAITQHLKNSENSNNKNMVGEKSEPTNKNENVSTKGGDLLTDCIVIKNVSSDINETNIRDFFSDEGLIPEKVYFNKPDSEGQSDVYVVFPKISDAKHAIKKNSQLLGSTKVSVDLVSKPSVMLAMGLPFDPRELFLKGHEEHKDPNVSENSENTGNNNQQIKESFPSRKMSPPQYDNHPRGGRSFNPRYNRNDEPPPGGYRPRQPFRYRRDHERHPAERGGFDDRMLNNKNIEGPRISAPPQDFGKPGCVVALGNIPYAATTEDILNFFKDFDGLQPENVIRRYDERNRPTADSRVSLNSPEDAIRAVEILNHRYILGRPIYVDLVNN